MTKITDVNDAGKHWYHGVKWMRITDGAIGSSDGKIIIHSVAEAECGKKGDYYECEHVVCAHRLSSDYFDFILAAPELATQRDMLLEALKRCLNFIQNTECELGITLDSGEIARAAIKAAEGE